MKTFDIKSMMPTTLVAETNLLRILRENKSEKMIKIIHGYGSTGVGGTIKNMVHRTLKKKQNSNEIKAFIPGEATVSLIGYDEIIRMYRSILIKDSDFKKGNDGITYVILK
ncbi:MAG: Smr/MutS family protein [Firmicutes bacterium]|nr:Smr/MutS family protein [Bacillota bacterium]